MIVEGKYLVLEEKKGGEGKEGSNVIFGLQSLYDQAFKLDNTSLRDTGDLSKKADRLPAWLCTLYSLRRS